MLGALPFFHVFGMSTAHELCHLHGLGQCPGAQTPAPAASGGDHPKFKTHLCAPGAHHVHRHPGAPGHRKQADLTSIKGCFSGSAPLPLEVIKEFQKNRGHHRGGLRPDRIHPGHPHQPLPGQQAQGRQHRGAHRRYGLPDFGLERRHHRICPWAKPGNCSSKGPR
jgi:hypothetical protein